MMESRIRILRPARWFVFLSLLLVGVLVLGACNRGAAGEPTAGDAIVYVAVPLSGFQANGGQTVLGGVRLAAEELNQAGGILGYRIVVRPLDDESDSEVAVENVEEIRNAIAADEQVIGVIGHLNSGQTLAAMELYKDMSLLVITPTASEESLTQRGYANFFRVNANDNVQAEVTAAFMTGDLNVQRVAVIHNDTEYGRGLAAAFIRELEGRGGVTAVKLEVEEGQSLYDDEIVRLQQADAQAIFYAGYEIEAPYLRLALVEAGIDIPMLASDGAFLAATIDEALGAAEGMYVSAFAPSPRSLDNARWFEAYQAVEYRNPDTYSVNGYVAMQVLAEGIRQANELDRDRIAAALRNSAVDTLLSSLSFQENGDLTAPQIWIYQVQDDEFRQVR